ncbi:uncharacterized protein BT62DRAFT_105505 [Guyanagaster necrorhizus]|uniref:Uncharacterized protein n=1 Tax=Guyanagaster necrorhizus TaxID=856835 RepID=A0A9P8ASK9_9AGAR|nr:uncharacterized protein BT62DRAFT_105505 [Guyanagaster necrorhizus MCA 3950]KAG7446240.1 hypothetical protein BT62DRAFT_105505 [Guyanagaster necrorhizus MCA 3950]
MSLILAISIVMPNLRNPRRREGKNRLMIQNRIGWRMLKGTVLLQHRSLPPLTDPGNSGVSKSSAGTPSRVANAIKKKTLLSNEDEAEETVADAYDKFFRSGQESDHEETEVSSQTAISNKNAKKRPTETIKPDENLTNSKRVGQRKAKQSDAETSKRASTAEELEAAQATIRAAIAQNSLRRNQATVNDTATADAGLSAAISKLSSSIMGGPPTYTSDTVPATETRPSSSSISKEAKSRRLKKLPHVNGHSHTTLHAPLEPRSSAAVSTIEMDVFGPVTNPSSAVKKWSESGPKNNGREGDSSLDKSSPNGGVTLKEMISGDDEELGALIRGPQRGRMSVGQILSVAIAGRDEDDVNGELEEDEEIQPKYRSFSVADASSSEDEIEDGASSDAVPETGRQASVPLVASSIPQEHRCASPAMGSSAADLKVVVSKGSEQPAGDDDHPVNGALVPAAPEEESHAPPISPKLPTRPEPDSPIESFDEPQQAFQTHIWSPPPRTNGLLKRMKGKSVSLSPQKPRLQPPMLSRNGKLNGVSEEADPEAPKIASQLPSTQLTALMESIDFDSAPKPVSPTLRRQSLDTWAILKPSSPNTDADSSMNYDELVSMNYEELTSSTRNDRRLASQVTTQQTAERASPSDFHDSQPTDDPLFLPSECQHPFPYSQYQAGTDDQALDANDSEDEDEVEATVKSERDVTASSFRRLTDIGSQRNFFSNQPLGRQKAAFSRLTQKDLYGNEIDDDESDSSDGDSDRGTEKTSHIPQSRRAGAK